MGTIRPASVAVLLASILVLIGLAASAVPGLPRTAQAQGPPYELPTPTPTSPPARTPTPTPTPTPTATPLRLLTPIPVIGIRGKLTLRGARLSALQITTPPLVRIMVRCRGGKRLGCPVPRASFVVPDSTRRTVKYRLKRFQRSYRAGAVLEIGVARRGTIGRYARFAIREGRFPTRRNGCATYGTAKSRRCPA
jgi:hypothetical protein